MAKNSFVATLKPSHLDWGVYRNPTNRPIIEGESYVKIPSDAARDFQIKRGSQYTAHFTNGFSSMRIKAAGNGPLEDGIQYAKQFEGIGRGACKAFTPWYTSCGAKPGDKVEVRFLSPHDLEFTIL